MKIFIKCLKGGSTATNVDETTSIIDLKRRVEKDLKIPINQQTLLAAGLTLQDDRTVGDYPKIKEGAKLYVVIKKPETLQSLLIKNLTKFYSEEQCKIIVNEFMRNFRNRIDSLSLDDIEEIAKANLKGNDNA